MAPMQLTRPVLALACAGAVLAGAPPRAEAYRRSTVDDDPARPSLFWPSSRITFHLASSSIPGVSADDARVAFRASLRTWSLAGGCTSLTLIDGGEATGLTTNLERTTPDSQNRVVFRSVDWPLELGPETLALTSAVYRRSTGEIVDADIDLNAVDHVWSAGPVPAAGHDDVENTVTHELGHAIGFAHTDIADATMFASAALEETAKRDLADDDQQAVCDVYPGGTPRGPRSSCAISPAQGSPAQGSPAQGSPAQSGGGRGSGGQGTTGVLHALAIVGLVAWRRRRARPLSRAALAARRAR